MYTLYHWSGTTISKKIAIGVLGADSSRTCLVDYLRIPANRDFGFNNLTYSAIWMLQAVGGYNDRQYRNSRNRRYMKVYI